MCLFAKVSLFLFNFPRIFEILAANFKSKCAHVRVCVAKYFEIAL